MQLFDTTQLGLEAAMTGAAARQQAIANNLANANTPGYRRQDVSFGDALSTAMQRGDRQALETFTPETTTDASAPVRVDGNSVDIDVENAEQAKNGILYESLVSVSRARIDILESAMGAR